MLSKRCTLMTLCLAAGLLAIAPDTAHAQGNGKAKKGDGPSVTVSGSIVLTSDMRVEIRDYYDRHPVGDVEALPPGIRMRLARGKPLPPGIAKKTVPGDLRSRLRLPDGYQVIEVGLDVLLVEVATAVVHDILTDAIL